MEYFKNVLLRLYETGEAESLLPVVAQVGRGAPGSEGRLHREAGGGALACATPQVASASTAAAAGSPAPCSPAQLPARPPPACLQVLQFSPAEVARCKEALHGRSGHLAAGAGASECGRGEGQLLDARRAWLR